MGSQLGTVRTLIYGVCMIRVNIHIEGWSVREADSIDHQGHGAREGWTVYESGYKLYQLR